MADLIPVLSLADVAEGDMIAGSVCGQEVLICQVEGQFYAVENLCSHARQKLHTGRLKGFELRCPLHGARFDIRTGGCSAGPADRPIKTFPVLLEGGKVCILI